MGSRAEASFYTESDAEPGTAPDYLRHVGLSPLSIAEHNVISIELAGAIPPCGVLPLEMEVDNKSYLGKSPAALTSTVASLVKKMRINSETRSTTPSS